MGGFVKVFSELNISPGKYTEEHCLEKGNDWISLLGYSVKGLFVDIIEERERTVWNRMIWIFSTNFSLVLIILFCIVEICIIIKLLTQIFRFLIPFCFIKLYVDTVIVFCLMTYISEYCVQDIYCHIEFH